jgi:hypothetical protein
MSGLDGGLVVLYSEMVVLYSGKVLESYNLVWPRWGIVMLYSGKV